ncbi:tetratricopeptide repeat protein [Dactylosporangium sp. CA-139066]|uniref:tetratricopeptide repeat protein n=1 Tax=Dactylosporangium sp. CA-139066 TaxID=3239930 RepID=UPI003D89FA1F
MTQSERGAALDVTLTVAGDEVRLTGAGVDVAVAHQGVQQGLRNALYDVRRERTRAGTLTLRDVTPEDGAEPGLMSLRRAGRLVADSFLPAPVAAALRGLLERAVRDHVALRVALDAPGLARLPWEALPDPATGGPLALHPRVHMYRRSSGRSPSRLPGPLRIVVAIASPDSGGGPLLDYEQELRAVLRAVHGARRSQARVEVVQFATTAAIRAALQADGGVHVLHISAHGAPGVLLLEDAEGGVRKVTAEQLLDEAVPSGRMPPVISLAACYTDVEGEQEGASFAARLAQHGACAVIGTQTSVTDRYATLLFARIYGELAADPRTDVVAAVADARRAVQRELLQASDPLQRRLAGLDEWGVVTVLANGPEVSVIDPGRPPVPAPVQRSPVWGAVQARPVGQFVGRRRLQRELPAILDGDRHSALLLHGIGGIGKTTLAAEVLHRTTTSDPAWRVATLFGAVTVDGLLSAVASVAGRELIRRQAAGGPQMAAVQAAARVDLPWPDRFALLREDVLGDVPILVVLDNFEDNLLPGDGWPIADDALAELLATWAASPGLSRLLLTSRHPVTFPPAVRGRVFVQPVGPLSAAETGKLLWSLPHVDRHSGEDGVERVWRLVGGHPRSLEYLDALLDQGNARFDDVTDRLTRAVTARLGGERAAGWLARERTLDVALADAVTLIADDVLLAEHLARLEPVPDAVETLAAISVYRRPVPVPALGSDDLEPVLRVLTASSLIHHDPDAGTVFMHRWTATELHRHWASAADRIEGAHRAAAEYWWRRAATLAQDRRADVDDLLEARYHQLAAGDWGAAASTTEAICAQLHEWGAWDRETGLIHDTLRWLPEDSPRQPTWAYQLGELAQMRGDYPEAERRYQQSLAQFEVLGDDAGVSVALHGLGALAHERGDHEQAEELYRRSLAIDEPRGDERARAVSLHQLGVLARDRGNDDEAERRHREALAICERLGDESGVAMSAHQLGMLAHDRGDFDEADRRYQQALAVFEPLGQEAAVARTVHQLGMLAQDRGLLSEAERRYHQSIAIKERLGDQAGLAGTISQLGFLQTAGGHPGEAVAYHLQALGIRLAIGVPHAVIDVRALKAVRTQLGAAAFAGIARRYIDDEALGSLVALFDVIA